MVRVVRSGQPNMEVAMTVKSNQPAGSRPDKVEQASKDGAPKPVVSMIRELGLKVCPVSERIIKETSVKRRKAMEMLADL